MSEPNTITCEDCGEENAAWARYCVKCGHKQAPTQAPPDKASPRSIEEYLERLSVADQAQADALRRALARKPTGLISNEEVERIEEQIQARAEVARDAEETSSEKGTDTEEPG